MPIIRVILDGDGAWPDLAGHEDKVVHLGEGAAPMQIACLSGGMKSGRPSLAIRLDLPPKDVPIPRTPGHILIEGLQDADRRTLDKCPHCGSTRRFVGVGVVVAETSVRAFLVAADAIRAKYGKEAQDG